jgi:hypothetical protein
MKKLAARDWEDILQVNQQIWLIKAILMNLFFELVRNSCLRGSAAGAT